MARIDKDFQPNNIIDRADDTDRRIALLDKSILTIPGADLRYEKSLSWPAAYIDMLLTQPGLRGLWTFGSVDASGDLLDISGLGQTMTRNGDPTYDAPSDGMFSYGNCDNTGDLWNRPDEAAHSITGLESEYGAPGLTIVAWVNVVNGTAGNDDILAKWVGGGQRAYTLRWTSSGSVFRFQVSPDGEAGSSQVVDHTVQASANKWHFVAGRFLAGVSMAVWMDDITVQDSTALAQVYDSTAYLAIGGEGGVGNWPGYLSTIALYASALTDYAIARLYNLSRKIYGV